MPVTLSMLSELVAEGELVPVSRTAFAVTPKLREAYVSGDDDELAEAAMAEAARASLRLLAAIEPDSPEAELPLRRAVLAADVDDATHRPDLDDAVVRVNRPLGLADVASVHVDLKEAEPAVRAAIAVIDEADLGDEDAELTVGDALDHGLAWYAPQEVPILLELL